MGLFIVWMNQIERDKDELGGSGEEGRLFRAFEAVVGIFAFSLSEKETIEKFE